MASKYSLEAIFGARDKFSAIVARMQGRWTAFTSRASKSAAQLNSAIDKIGGGFRRAGIAVAAAGAAVGAASLNVITTGANFEQAITAVGAVGLQTREQIADLEKEALRLGATTKFTATEAANAMETMARAGFSNQDILAGVGGVLSAAAASGLEMEEVANHVSNALKGMGLETKEASRVADVLALASSRTNSSIGSLGESLSNVASTARQLKVPFEDVVAGVALLQDVGLDASVAGSAMNTMLTQLAVPTDNIQKQMKKWGISFKHNEKTAAAMNKELLAMGKAADVKVGDMLPFAKVIEQIAIASEKAGGNFDQVAFIAELVGLRGQKAASNLKDLFESGKLSSLTQELQGAAGSAQRMADLRMKNVLGDWELFKSAVDGVKIGLFNLRSEGIRGIVQGMTDWVTKNQELITSGTDKFLKDLSDAMPTIVMWLERIGRAAVPILAVAAAVKVWAGAQWLLNAAMTANPVTLWIVGITAAVALIAAFWPEISAFFGRVWEGAKQLGARVWAALTSAWEPLKGFFRGLFEFFVGLIGVLFWPQIQLIIGAVNLIRDNWAVISTFFRILWETVKIVFEGVWMGIVAAAGLYVEVMKAIWSPIVDFFVGLWDAAAGAFKTAFSWVLEKIEWAVNAVRDLGRGVIGDLFGGGDDADEASQGGAARSGSGPQAVSPQESIVRSISESRSSSTAEVTISPAPGAKATMKKAPPKGSGIRLQPSGAFG